MLTEEQIKNLKPGDPLIISGTFVAPSAFGNVIIHHKEQMLSSISSKSKAYVHPSAVSLPSEHGTSVPPPKYDPCRPFKKGDIVEPKIVNGRIFDKYVDPITGKKCVVIFDEKKYGFVFISHEGHTYSIDPAYLELVTPVEEQEPYKVWDTTFSFNVGVEDSKAVFYYGADMSTCQYTKEQALAAAEAERDRLNAERDRLNAEYRKEHGND